MKMKRTAAFAIGCMALASAATAEASGVTATFGDWYEALTTHEAVSFARWNDGLYLGAYVAIPVTGCPKKLAASDIQVVAGTFSSFGKTIEVKTEEEMWNIYGEPVAQLLKSNPQSFVIDEGNWTNEDWVDDHDYYALEYELSRSIWGTSWNPNDWKQNQDRQWILVSTKKTKEWHGWKYFFVAIKDSDAYTQVNLHVEENPGPKPALLPMPSGSGEIPSEWQKARTLTGVATVAVSSPNSLKGVFELKCGKANKKGIASVSAKLTSLDGKKQSFKAQKVSVTSGAVEVRFDGLTVVIEGDSFSGGDGLAGGVSVTSASVGGNLKSANPSVSVAYGELSKFGGDVQTQLLPNGEKVVLSGSKWTFAKAAGVKFAKQKGATEKELVVDDTKGKTNFSGLKLTYTPKTGIFKGSFKVYALEGSGAKAKLKKYSLKVSGFVVDGVGYGAATLKKPALTWLVTVE